jgi:cation diffusion facilitator CzcD-associated flavoprotein CzcO
VEIYDAVVIGAGQAGLSTSYHLARHEVRHVVLDRDDAPGGAWQHRWDALTMHDVHRVADLPGAELPPGTGHEQANEFVPAYFAEYERRFGLPVERPVRVRQVVDIPSDDRLLQVQADDGRVWTTRTLVNATGTWTHPFVPHLPGMETFVGEQLHTAHYPGPEHFRDRRVVVVGGGASAVQFIGALAPITDTVWVTRREPVWVDREFTPEVGREVVALVEQRVRQGLPPRSVVSVTGLQLREQEREAERRGAYADRRPMFTSIEPDGVRWDRPPVSGQPSFERADVILWATGFRPAIAHLAPLRLRSELGGIRLDGTTAVADPRVQLVGYGPSASTIGANRAGRTAAVGVTEQLRRASTAGRPPAATRVP